MVLQEWATALLGAQYAAFKAGGSGAPAQSSAASPLALKAARTALLT